MIARGIVSGGMVGKYTLTDREARRQADQEKKEIKRLREKARKKEAAPDRARSKHEVIDAQIPVNAPSSEKSIKRFYDSEKKGLLEGVSGVDVFKGVIGDVNSGLKAGAKLGQNVFYNIKKEKQLDKTFGTAWKERPVVTQPVEPPKKRSSSPKKKSTRYSVKKATTQQVDSAPGSGSAISSPGPTAEIILAGGGASGGSGSGSVFGVSKKEVTIGILAAFGLVVIAAAIA